jgi:phosphoesterase RecJ-like protein
MTSPGARPDHGAGSPTSTGSSPGAGADRGTGSPAFTGSSPGADHGTGSAAPSHSHPDVHRLSRTVPDKNWDAAVAALQAAGEICLACHVRPDGDALGSMLAVAQALRVRGRARVIASFGDQPFVVPRSLRFLPGADLLSPPGAVPARPEVMVTFDVSSVDRLGVLAGRAAAAGALIVLDHHVSNPGFGTINLIDPAAAATSVLAARLIELLGVDLTADIATGLYTALATDTGSFRFSATPAVHLLAARLLETGIDAEAIAQQLWDSAPFGSLHVLSAALGRAVLEPAEAAGHGLVWTVVTKADRAALGLPAEVAEGVIDEVRRSEEADVAVVFKESDDGRWHVSARSKGRVDVGRACTALGGGGHSQAAGFTTSEPVPDAMARLRALLSETGAA